MNQELKAKVDSNTDLANLMGDLPDSIRLPQDPPLSGNAQSQEKAELLRDNGTKVAQFISTLSGTLKEDKLEDSLGRILTKHFVEQMENFNKTHDTNTNPEQFLITTLCLRGISSWFVDEGNKKYEKRLIELGVPEIKKEIEDLKAELIGKSREVPKDEGQCKKLEDDLNSKIKTRESLYEEAKKVSLPHIQLSNALQGSVNKWGKPSLEGGVSKELLIALNAFKEALLSNSKVKHLS